MQKRITGSQKRRRSLQHADSSEGRLGKRPVKRVRTSEKQTKGDKRIRKEVQ
jgi:hypothetical protein